MLKFFHILTVALLFLIPGSMRASSVVEAKKKGVHVYKAASKKSGVLLTLGKGETLEAQDRKGMYWHVKLPNGSVGYVSAMKVKRKKIEADGALSSALRAAVQEKTSDDSGSARARSAVMGVRGLDESKDLDFIGNIKPNLRTVYKMESSTVTASQLNRLEGKIFSEIESEMKN